MDIDFQIVAEGTSGEDILPLYNHDRPDAVLMRVNQPIENGIHAGTSSAFSVSKSTHLFDR